VSFQQTFEPLPVQFARFTALLRSLTPHEEAAPVPGMEWTASEVGAHVLTVVNRYLAPSERAASRARLAALNAEDVSSVAKTAAEVADELDATIAQLAHVASSFPLDGLRDFHLGLSVTMAAAWANLLGELLVHGDDISRATKRHWSMDDELLEGIWRNLLPAAAGWLRPEAHAVNELYRLNFPFGPVTLRIAEGEVRVDHSDDVDLSADHTIDIVGTAQFTLQFPYRRACISDPRTALLASRFFDI
jgi:hypothetical protein